MAENKSPGSPCTPVIWGILIIFLGVVLLLQTFDVLSWSLWGTLWRFWPALIIIIGLCILLRHAKVWLVTVLVIVILGASLGFAIWQHGTRSLTGGAATKNFTQPIGNLAQAQIDIDFSAGSLTIDNLAANSASLVEAEAEAKDNISTMKTDFRQQGNAGRLSLDSTNQQYWPGGGIRWFVNITPRIPLSLNIKSAASNLKLDLSELKPTQLNLELNASSCELKMPSPSGVLSATIKANAGNVEIVIPDGTAASIRATTNVGTLDIDRRFVKKGSDYATANFEGAANRIEMTVDTNVGRVRVH